MTPSRPVDRFLYEASMGCLMAVLPTADAAPIVEWSHEVIQPSDLAGDGFESSPHVTLAYGFEPGVTAMEVQKVVSQWGRPQMRFTLGPLARFDNSPEHDVLYASVKFDSDLRELNGHLIRTFGERLRQSYPTYTPHLCLAYLRKGACPGLTGHAKWDDSTYSLQSLVYSMPESIQKFPVGLGAQQAVLPEHARRANRRRIL